MNGNRTPSISPTRNRIPLLLTLALLAAIAPGTVTARELGVSQLSGPPSRCGQGTCYPLEVTCPDIEQAASVILRVRSKASGANRGTIYLATGGGGRKFWADSFGRPAEKALKKLRKKGFKTVEVLWEDSWLDGRSAREGQAKLACRPATVARWIYDNLHAGGAAAPYCATGNSGGSSQVSYMLSHYGLDQILSSVVPSSGPPMGRIDRGCLERQDPDLPNMIYGSSARQTIDRSFGFYRNDGPCVNRQTSFGKRFTKASVAARGPRNYRYRNTMVWFVFGADDSGSSVGQGLFYHDKLVESGSPLVGMSVAPRTPHAAPSTRNGANMIRDVLLETCVLHE